MERLGLLATTEVRIMMRNVKARVKVFLIASILLLATCSLAQEIAPGRGNANPSGRGDSNPAGKGNSNPPGKSGDGGTRGYMIYGIGSIMMSLEAAYEAAGLQKVK
jgi:hypothetical protein